MFCFRYVSSSRGLPRYSTAQTCRPLDLPQSPQTPPDCGVGYRPGLDAIHACQYAGDLSPSRSKSDESAGTLAGKALGPEPSAATWFNPHPKAQDKKNATRRSARSDRCIPHGCVVGVWSLGEVQTPRFWGPRVCSGGIPGVVNNAGYRLHGPARSPLSTNEPLAPAAVKYFHISTAPCLRPPRWRLTPQCVSPTHPAPSAFVSSRFFLPCIERETGLC